ncbi:ketoreductase [Sporothrix schenckii 1099-18]|uniref:Ketoreductase n=1 Tax=Sporothrix schenckii 1099-18 TaxID=1397361 RepID=A0A0F2MHW1_SPOSC|nr:ketoreductase [Sporothrix schenckii 1099-18]KJR89288.1 ketoreductase [Sporothrix schenckii 1099-18]
MAPSPFPSVKLNDGHEIPLVGFGVGTKLSGRDNESEAIIRYAKTAIEAGFYHLDGAEAYQNEEELGAAIRASGVPRDALFVTTKTLVHDDEPLAVTLDRSLAKLGLDYVDLYLIHNPRFARTPADHQTRWAELEAAQAAGKVRSIGVSNYLQEHLEALLATAKVVPAVNQIEHHPYFQRPDLVAFSRQHGITVTAYGPLVPLTKGAPGPLDAVYPALAAKYGVTTTEIALRWTIQQGLVPITTSTNADRLKSIAATVPGLVLSDEDVAEITTVGKKKEFRGYGNRRVADVPAKA